MPGPEGDPSEQTDDFEFSIRGMPGTGDDESDAGKISLDEDAAAEILGSKDKDIFETDFEVPGPWEEEHSSSFSEPGNSDLELSVDDEPETPLAKEMQLVALSSLPTIAEELRLQVDRLCKLEVNVTRTLGSIDVNKESVDGQQARDLIVESLRRVRKLSKRLLLLLVQQKSQEPK